MRSVFPLFWGICALSDQSPAIRASMLRLLPKPMESARMPPRMASGLNLLLSPVDELRYLEDGVSDHQ